MTIHNPTHKDLDWLVRDPLPTHVYSAVIRPASPLGQTPLTEEMDDQNFSQALLQMIRKGLAKAVVHRPTEARVESFPPKVNWSKVGLYTQKRRASEC